MFKEHQISYFKDKVGEGDPKHGPSSQRPEKIVKRDTTRGGSRLTECYGGKRHESRSAV